MKKRLTCITLAILLLCSMTTQAFAAENQNVLSQKTVNDDIILDIMNEKGLTQYSLEKEPVITIPNRIFLNEEDAGILPGITTDIYVEPKTNISPKTYGEGYVIGRARSWMTASDGYIRKGYKKGTFSSVASTVLSFIPGHVTTTVAAILSVVGLAASSNDMVSGETLITYRYKYRDGEGRWSSDPNTSGYWHLGLRTGQRETFKHVIGGKLNKTTQVWTLEMKNYNTTPIKTEKSPNYTQSDSWLAEQGRQRVTVGNVYVETAW